MSGGNGACEERLEGEGVVVVGTRECVSQR